MTPILAPAALARAALSPPSPVQAVRPATASTPAMAGASKPFRMVVEPFRYACPRPAVCLGRILKTTRRYVAA